MNLKRLTFVFLIAAFFDDVCFSQLIGLSAIKSNEAYAQRNLYYVYNLKAPYSTWHYGSLSGQNIIFNFKNPDRSLDAIIQTQQFEVEAGPLFGSGNLPTEQEKLNYSKVWSVLSHDIKSHIRDFNADQKIDLKIHSIYAWPARGNPYFEQFNGFKLQRMDYDLAPFYDFNKDGQYNPDDGDFPHIDQAKFDQIPSAIYYSVFHTLFYARLEVGLTNWTYQCEENTLLNKAIFSSYKISNYSSADLIDFKFCSELYTELGCRDDDYMGTHPSSNSCFWYNSKNVDGGAGTECDFIYSGFGLNPPAQFFAYLNQPMSSCAYVHLFGLNGLDLSFIYRESQLRSYLKGYRNSDLEYINPKTGLPTLFPYNGDVTDPNAWSMIQEEYKWPKDIHLFPTCDIGTLLKGQSVKVDFVLHNSRVLDADHLQNVKLGLEQVNEIKALYLNSFEEVCLDEICLDECVWPGDTDNNGIVNYLDAVQIFKSIDYIGPTRPYSHVWAGTSATSWSQNVPRGANHKYVDANGDGIIAQNDVQLVSDHHLYFRGVPLPETEDCSLGQDIILDYFTDSLLKNNIVLEMDLIPNEKSIQGISFQLNASSKDFSFSFTAVNTMWKDSAKYNFWSSFLGFNRTGIEEKKYSFVIFHPSGKNHSNLDTFKFRLRGQIRNPEILKQNLDLKICNAKLWFEDGSVKNLYSNQLTFFSPNSVSTQNSDLDEILFFPNPVSQQLFIQSDEKIETLKIFDLYGRFVGYYTLPGSCIDVSHLINGIYFVEARVGQKSSIQKLSVVNY